MVLQQQPSRAVLWGHCDEQTGCGGISVTLDGGAKVAAQAGGINGTWIAKLPPTEGSSDAHTISVSDGTSNATLEDVLFGDVWMCSGQSNSTYFLACMNLHCADRVLSLRHHH